MLTYFYWFWGGGSLCRLDFDACFLPQIREVLHYNLLQYTFCPLSLSSSSGIPIILILFPFMVSLISQILPSWSSSCLSLFFSASLFSIIFFKDFIYLFDRDRQREGEHKQGEWERKKQAPSRAGSPVRCREPDAGLDPRTLGSRPEPKADA